METNNFLTTKDVAIALEISESTVRRWANTGYLPCYRIGEAKYRKFKSEDISKIKYEMYSNSITTIEASIVPHKKTISDNILPLPHPSHYLMHRYWGRKAHNVVSEYINNFTNEGDIVLDPFMGSGITIIESLKLNRKAIGIDLNPMSTFIVSNTISNVNLDDFKQSFKFIHNKLTSETKHLYETSCPICNKTAYIEIGIWENDNLVKIRGNCPEHGIFKKDPDKQDFIKIDEYKNIFLKLDKNGELSYPKDQIMSYVKRSGRESINELFTERALIMLSFLHKEINMIDDLNIRNLLMLCFTSLLPNVSRMIPGDIEKATYRSGWVISKFWTPTVHTERNIFNCFKLRYNTILKGKKELQHLNQHSATLYSANSTNLSAIESNSIDYIFTDPPYGESIAYFALSHFWNSWLNFEVDYENEIIIDSYRSKLYDDYDLRIKQSFAEMSRVLKPNHYMSFTFHNRDLNIWKSILEGCLESGFELINIVMQKQAVSSGTQGINRKNTLTGDFVYNFKKSMHNKLSSHEYLKNAEDFILNTIKDFLIKNNGSSSSELYQYIIPIIAQKHAYCDNNGKVINIDNLLQKNFSYVQLDKSEYKGLGEEYRWIAS